MVLATKESALDNSAHDDQEYYSKDSHDPYEEEEALSLCDLPIYSDSFKWDDDFSTSSTSKMDQSLSFDENDNDYFEFFSGDFSAEKNSSINNKDIIFCGKIIRYKEFPHVEKKLQKSRKKKSIFQYWKSPNDNKGGKNDKSFSSSYDKAGKVSVLGSSSSKSRWYLYMFGMTKLPTVEMELRDMRSRQSRRAPTTMFSPKDYEAETTKENVSSKKAKRRKSGKSWWGLLRVLSCRSRHAEVVAKASIGCGAIPRA